jgi:flagellar biosynthesis/type III secretory pathway protein FliH
MNLAVEWLVNQLKKNHGFQAELYSEFEQAKEMEKEQIETHKYTKEDIAKAYQDGVSDGHNFGYPAIDNTDKYIQSIENLQKVIEELKRT